MATKVTDILQKSMMLCSSARRKLLSAEEDINDTDGVQARAVLVKTAYKFDNHGKKLNNNNIAHGYSSGFKWSSEKITEQDLVKLVRDANDFVATKTAQEKEINEHDVLDEKYGEWKPLFVQRELRIWRKPINSNGLYEYKVYGTFSDITADEFYHSQVDSEYRKHWDSFTMELDVIDRDYSSGNEVHHWVMKFPQPLRNRDFVYLRKSGVCNTSGAMVIVSRATNHPSRPEDQKFVRVTDYKSDMVIWPHKNTKEVGMDFVLSFLHDPKATSIPSFLMNKFTEFTGIPGMIQNIYDAAKTQKNYYAKKVGCQ